LKLECAALRHTTLNTPSPRETTHRHHAPPVTRPRPRVDPAAQLGTAAVVARNRLHPFSAAAVDDVGGRAIVLRIHICFTVHTRVVTFEVRGGCVWESMLAITWTRAVISCRVNCCCRPVLTSLLAILAAAVLRPPQDGGAAGVCKSYFL